MRSLEPNVHPDSEYFMHHPGTVAAKIYFYPTSIGLFDYEAGYHLRRTSFDSFLLFYIEKGSCMLMRQNTPVRVPSDSFVLLDCYQPHEYFYDQDARVLWLHFDGPLARIYCDLIRSANAAKAGGAKVLFTFCPCAAGDVADFARTAEWMAAYDALLRDGFSYDGILGSCRNYVFDTQYFFDCAFHTNNYGRTWRTYTMYKDLCAYFGIEVRYQNGDLGTDYQSCLFEKDAAGNILTEPKYKVDWLQ